MSGGNDGKAEPPPLNTPTSASVVGESTPAGAVPRVQVQSPTRSISSEGSLGAEPTHPAPGADRGGTFKQCPKCRERVPSLATICSRCRFRLVPRTWVPRLFVILASILLIAAFVLLLIHNSQVSAYNLPTNPDGIDPPLGWMMPVVWAALGSGLTALFVAIWSKLNNIRRMLDGR